MTSRNPKKQSAPEILIQLRDELGGWRAVEKHLKINRGYLSQIANGKRKPSSKVLIALGLPLEHVSVEPLSCGHAPLRKSCPICNQQKYAPHPVMRISKIRRILQNPYLKDS